MTKREIEKEGGGRGQAKKNWKELKTKTMADFYLRERRTGCVDSEQKNNVTSIKKAVD